jgi:hypothetical protein
MDTDDTHNDTYYTNTNQTNTNNSTRNQTTRNNTNTNQTNNYNATRNQRTRTQTNTNQTNNNNVTRNQTTRAQPNTLAETNNTETDTTYFSSSPYDSFRELNNITRLWGRPRNITTDVSSNLFTREFTYFLNFPLSASREQSEGLSLEEVQRETSETTYDSSFSTTQCPISFDEFQSGEPILQIRRCGHIFKPDELRRWLTRHTGCPVCRCDLQSVAEDYTRYATNQLTQENNTNSDEDDEVDYSDLPDLIDP